MLYLYQILFLKGAYQEKATKNGKNKNRLNEENNDWKGKIIQKFNGINKRNESLKKQNKKEKKKFQKLSAEALTETLNMFKNDSKTTKMRNFSDMLALNTKSMQKSNENGKLKVQVDKPAVEKLVHQKQQLENILNNYNLTNKKANPFKVDPDMTDSRQEAKRLFGKIISPVKLNDFFRYRNLFKKFCNCNQLVHLMNFSLRLKVTIGKKVLY